MIVGSLPTCISTSMDSKSMYIRDIRLLWVSRRLNMWLADATFLSYWYIQIRSAEYEVITREIIGIVMFLGLDEDIYTQDKKQTYES